VCGIAGAIGRIDAQVAGAICRMHQAQHHRGPDDEGAWTSVATPTGDGVSFSFRRLAIIDLSPEGHQPMVDPATGNVVVFNGELYNYKVLRRELERDGLKFRSQSDTEVLLHAYARWGIEALRRLRGMFAFAIWDERQQLTLLARDRLGIKPLYLCAVDRPESGKVVLFASELRALLAGGLVERRINPASIASYVWNGFVVGPETIITGIQLLAPGTTALVRNDGTFELRRYWSLPRHEPAPDGVERLREALETSVRQHLVSDVPLGVFLSGGIDSSAVTALAVKAAVGRVRTFNLSFDEAQYDESPYARAVAEALGTDHSDVRLTQMQFRSQLDAALASIDQPTFDAINSYFISRAVREAGMTVALAGTGGDELFGGYKSFVEIPRARLASRALAIAARPISACFRGVAGLMGAANPGQVAPQTRWGKLGDVFATKGELVGLYQTAYALFTRDFASELVGGSSDTAIKYGLPQTRTQELRDLVDGEETLHSISILELTNFIGERLLRDTDAASMAVSLEVRVPLLDHEFVEASARVDTRERFYPLQSKKLLRDIALGDLNSKLFDRPKRGFELPIDAWCRQALRSDIDETFSDGDRCRSAGLEPSAVARLWATYKSGARGIYWSRIWAIFVLLRWCRAHGVSL
jgi:asparagine synthase (glutamine-hydrolysing)